MRLVGRDVPARLGTLVRDGARVRFVAAPGVAVRVDSQPWRAAGDGWLRTDADSGGASRVEVGSAGFRILRRVDSIGVRSWDAEREALRRFAGLPLFPLDPAWRLPGRLVPLATPRREAVMTEAGVPEEHVVVGTVRATIAGARYELTAFDGGRPTELFIVFADATSGEESYGFRFLRAARDTTTNAVTLDFNFAYNPDCAFSPYTTCPLPPPENRIRAAVRAGERNVEHAETTVAAATPSLGAPVPRYAVTTLAGERVEVGTADAPLTLLNVWATWCTSCREEMADLDALHRAYEARGVRVVAVSIDAGSTAKVERFAARQQLAMRVAHDADARVQSAFHVAGVPSTYLVGRDGRLRWMQVGGIHGATGAARAAIDSALADDATR